MSACSPSSPQVFRVGLLSELADVQCELEEIVENADFLAIEESLIDCDQDAIWVSATPKGHGAACHTGQKSCFYRRIVNKDGETVLEHTGEKPLFDPADVY